MKSSRQLTLTSFLHSQSGHKNGQSNNKPSQAKKESKQEQQKSDQDMAKAQSENEKKKDQNDAVELDISGSESSEALLPKQVKKKEVTEQANMQTKPKQQVNVDFYLNKRVSEPNGDFIDKIHKKWWDDYDKLEGHHGFIQWLFPNSFQSRFNRLAQPLTIQQAKQFRDNLEIAKRYQTSYIMMLEFYGMKLKCKQTGEIARSRHPMQRDKSTQMGKPFFEDRFYKTFLTSFHNHMRITRILSSLVMCGFGRYAKQLSIFLKHQINEGALQPLKKYGVYQRQWEQYSEYVQKEEEKNILLRLYEKNGKL